MEIKKPASDINIQKLTACFNLGSQLDDIDFLVIDYDQNIEHGFADTTTLDIYTRSGIILCVTAWETFIENILSIEFENRMSSITTPDEIRHTANSVAQAWVNKKSKINSQHLLEWAGNGWKHLINESFKSEIQSLNTPSSENIRNISKRYLALDITTCWKWTRVSPNDACRKLDSLIHLRGNLVHRGLNRFGDIGKKPNRNLQVSRNQLKRAVGLITHLGQCTAKVLLTREDFRKVSAHFRITI